MPTTLQYDFVSHARGNGTDGWDFCMSVELRYGITGRKAGSMHLGSSINSRQFHFANQKVHASIHRAFPPQSLGNSSLPGSTTFPNKEVTISDLPKHSLPLLHMILPGTCDSTIQHGSFLKSSILEVARESWRVYQTSPRSFLPTPTLVSQSATAALCLAQHVGPKS